jgi:hypothetical protein
VDIRDIPILARVPYGTFVERPHFSLKFEYAWAVLGRAQDCSPFVHRLVRRSKRVRKSDRQGSRLPNATKLKQRVNRLVDKEKILKNQRCATKNKREGNRIPL